MKNQVVLSILLGALAAPVLAITNAVAPGTTRAPAGDVQQGVVTQSGPGLLRVGERPYLTSSATLAYDRHGKRISMPTLASGKTVRFVAVPDGLQWRIVELWLTD